VNLENLDSVVDFISENHLIERGDHVGVGVSGGEDSMCLLHFLLSVRKQMDIQIVAINVNHNIRKSGRKDSLFVSKFCKDNKIQYIGYTVNVPEYAKQHKMGIEAAARIKRYECFALAVKKFKLHKIAIAHHQSDQAETILMHIFRGSGLSGASGMSVARAFEESGIAHCLLIRPFLETPKTDIIAYNYRNQVPHITDDSNFDNQYARNFLRNDIFPALTKEWRNVEKNIVDFGRNCKSDDDYLNSIVNLDAILGDGNHARIPLTFFAYPYSVVSRTLLSAFALINARDNIEKKHIDLVVTLAHSGENGSRVDLPNNLFAVKEYEYMAIVRRVPPTANKIYSFKIGKTNFAEYGTIIVTKTISYKDAISRGLMVLDVDKFPRTSKWRTRKEGDVITKFGSHSPKPLNAYFIEKKVPARLRDKIPILAYGSEVFAVAGYDISEKVKCVGFQTLEAYVIEVVKD
jgi:tRNA(Ile)-lysidine synthase